MDQPHSHHESSYRTGRTQVPKNHRGIIAFLLVLVIFLCGISTALGLMNIHLFRQLEEQLSEEDAALAFNRSETQATQEQTPVSWAALGLSGETLSEFWQQYMDLPCGIYITNVTDPASQAGLQPGDILLKFQGILTQTAQSLSDLLAQCSTGDRAELVIYRDGQQKTVHITID